MQNVFILHGEGFCAGAVTELRRLGIEVPVATTRGAGSREAFDQVLAPGAVHLFSTEARFGEIPAELERKVKPATRRDLEALAPSAHIVFQTLDRMNLKGYSVAELRRLYVKMVGFWRSMFELYQPEAIVMSGTPQFGFDNVVYQLARSDGRKTVLFRQTYLDDRMMICDGVEDIQGPTAREIEAAEPLPPEAFRSEVNDELIKAPMDMTQTRRKLSRAGVVRALIGWHQLGRQPITPWFLFDPTPRHAWVRWQTFKGRLHCRRCLAKYDEISQLPVDGTPYVYLPLHTEPEEGTIPNGGTFCDSMNVVETVAAALPRGWKLYVKEHPNQFNRKYLMSKGARSPAFYDALARIPGVVPIKVEVKGQALIRDAKAVVTISGTSGWEALQQGKNALIFGYPWYLRAPGVIRVDSIESCARALARIERGDETVSVERVGRYLRLMRDRYTRPMICAHDFVPLSKLSLPQHNEEFAAAVKRAIGPGERAALG